MKTESQGQQEPNLRVLERLAGAWNPPEVSGVVSVVDIEPHVKRLCFVGAQAARQISIYGLAFDEDLLRQRERARDFARVAKEFLDSASETMVELSQGVGLVQKCVSRSPAADHGSWEGATLRSGFMDASGGDPWSGPNDTALFAGGEAPPDRSSAR